MLIELMFKLEREQSFDTEKEKLWKFISRPENLNIITPPKLDFEIVSEIPEKMFNGLIVEYSIKIPVFGRRSWVTEIKHIREGVSFVDEQRLGPYKLWYHYHELKSTEEGCIMYDKVYYKPPFGILGSIANVLMIKNMLNDIFDYRFKELGNLF